MPPRKKVSKKPISSSPDVAQDILRRRLVDFGSKSALIGCETQKRELASLLTRSVNVGESNSLIIIGPRGCGKTLLLNNVLNEMRANNLSEDFIEISLNGILQTDDSIAIKEITRQLQLENTIGDRVFGSIAENLTFLLEVLKSDDKKTKAIFFVLDEFDLFCCHQNQSLLYNLFDAAQSPQTPIAVVGLTCRLDVLELLEKRVKSRFSHRTIYMFSNYNFDDYVALFRSLLMLPESAANVEQDYHDTWNENIEKLSRNSALLDILKRIYDYTKDIRMFKSFLFVAVCKCYASNDSMLIAVDDLEQAYKENICQNAKTLLLTGMSTLEVCLVLAMMRLTDIYDGEPFNFEMVHREYLKFATHRCSLYFDKTVVSKAFEHLIDLELALPTDRVTSTSTPGGGGTHKHYRFVNLMLDSMHIEELLQNKELPTELVQWAALRVT